MAKKARHRVDEEEAGEAFRFPDFDERKFIAHEYEQSFATTIAVGFALLLGVLAWAISRASLPAPLPWVVGVAGVIGAPYGIRILRPLSTEYTRGDWAWLMLTVFFGWLGLWFLFLNLWPVPG